MGFPPYYLRPERPDCKRVSVSLDKELLEDIDAAAIKMGCTRSGLFNMISYFYIRDLQNWQSNRFLHIKQNSESSESGGSQEVS